MKDVVKNDLFLTSDMIVSMSKEFGVPYTDGECDGKVVFTVAMVSSGPSSVVHLSVVSSSSLCVCFIIADLANNISFFSHFRHRSMLCRCHRMNGDNIHSGHCLCIMDMP